MPKLVYGNVIVRHIIDGLFQWPGKIGLVFFPKSGKIMLGHSMLRRKDWISSKFRETVCPRIHFKA